MSDIVKHTVFMKQLSGRVGQYLPPAYKNFHVAKNRWICQIYYGNEPRIHYEVSRPWTKNGQQLEIGLHFESRDKQRNWQLLEGFDQYLFELRAILESDTKAEVWDRGWAKVYELHPDEELTEKWLTIVAARWATFIAAAQPIMESLEKKG